MVQFFFKRSDSVLVSILKIRPSSNLVLPNQNWNLHIWQSRYPPNTEHKPPRTWPSLTQKIPLQKQLQIPIDMREALLLIRHCLKTVHCFVLFLVYISLVTASTRVFFVANFNKNQCKLYKGAVFWGKERTKSHHILKEKKSHMVLFRQMSYY
jgi:hypothetical protein